MEFPDLVHPGQPVAALGRQFRLSLHSRPRPCGFDAHDVRRWMYAPAAEAMDVSRLPGHWKLDRRGGCPHAGSQLKRCRAQALSHILLSQQAAVKRSQRDDSSPPWMTGAVGVAPPPSSLGT